MYAAWPDRIWGYVLGYGCIAALFGFVLLLIRLLDLKLKRDVGDLSETPHRGFEVKLTTGGSPLAVLREKDDHHG